MKHSVSIFLSICTITSLVACDGADKTTEDTITTEVSVEPSTEPSTEPSIEPSVEPAGEPDPTDENNIDNDGDGASENQGDCDDSDPALNIADADHDGQTTCEGDCDDNNASISDGTEESCDGIYNDCIGSMTAREGIPENEVDADGDGVMVCAGDCDDTDAFTYPGAAELDSTSACMTDKDNDGFGDDYDSYAGCCYTFTLQDTYGDTWDGAYVEVRIDGILVSTLDMAYNSYTETETVCTHNGASIDIEFISGSYDNEITLDIADPNGNSIYSATHPNAGSLYTDTVVCATPIAQMGTDCDDDDGASNPQATEVWYDGVDGDCSNNISDYDQDGDGQDSDQHGGTDCNDTDNTVYEGAIEILTDNKDNDCDGSVDERFDIETIDTGILYTGGQPATISVDAYDNVHLAYLDSGDIHYTVKQQGAWTNPITAPVSSYLLGEHIRGIVDGADRFQLAFSSINSGLDNEVEMIYVDTITNTWSSTFFVASLDAGLLDSGFQLGIDVDSSNRPSIGYYAQEIPWLFEVTGGLQSSSLLGMYTSLDENCVPIFGCFGNTGTYLSVAIDAQDANHIAFFNDVQSTENQYNRVSNESGDAYCSNPLTGSCSAYIEQNGGGIYNSIAVKPSSNQVCVAYQDSSNTDLMYACNANGGCGGWNSETVDLNNAGNFSKLVFTSNDEPYIAYYAGNSADLKVAHYQNNAWEIITVENYGNVGQYIDMAIDSNDILHIVYYNTSTQSLHYAYGR